MATINTISVIKKEPIVRAVRDYLVNPATVATVCFVKDRCFTFDKYYTKWMQGFNFNFFKARSTLLNQCLKNLWLPGIHYDWSLWPAIFRLFAVYILSLKSCFSRLHVRSFYKNNTCPYLQYESGMPCVVSFITFSDKLLRRVSYFVCF